MATMIDGESYLGHVLVRRLSKTEEVSFTCGLCAA